MMPPRFKPLANGGTRRDVAKAAIRFVAEVWDCKPSDYTFIGTRRGDRWRDHAIKGNRMAKVAAILAGYPIDQFDIYFCPNPFSGPYRRTVLAQPTSCAWCDIDSADPDGYDPQPNILWETSPGRFQGIWRWPEVSPGTVAEQISRNLWAKDGGDKGGWSVTKMLRLPGTINHKPQYQKPVVNLQVYDARPQKLPRSILAVPSKSVVTSATRVDVEGLDPYEIMRRYRRAMGLQAGTLMTAKRVMRADRSGVVYIIIVGMIAAGAQDAEISAVLLVNPYFTSKWGTSLLMAEDQIVRIRSRLEASQ
jgi:RepB DNA-primase from phage plasmid